MYSICNICFVLISAWKGCYSTTFLYENEAISTNKYEEMYDSESMTLDYCGQMCQGLHETNFMGKEVYNRAY